MTLAESLRRRGSAVPVEAQDAIDAGFGGGQQAWISSELIGAPSVKA